MRYSNNIRPISYLKEKTTAIIREITETREPMVITQNGNATFIVQDIKSFEQTQETMALLKILALGQNEITTGKFSSSDDFFRQMDKEIME
ncbi:MAG TPA: type II toxin-antitoxin system Phd/YefM family antitoxin [Paralcaligenes sp.]